MDDALTHEGKNMSKWHICRNMEDVLTHEAKNVSKWHTYVEIWKMSWRTKLKMSQNDNTYAEMWTENVSKWHTYVEIWTIPRHTLSARNARHWVLRYRTPMCWLRVTLTTASITYTYTSNFLMPGSVIVLIMLIAEMKLISYP